VKRFLGLRENLQQVEIRIAAACRRSGRDRGDIRIVAVTKYVSVDKTREVLDSGLEHIGENRWQDAKEKWEQLGSRGTWHFIGHLQTNKVKYVLGKFQYVHSLDRLSLAEELEKQLANANQTLNCFLQVNVSGEESKFGLAPEQLLPFAKRIEPMKHLRIVGLMTMAPFADEPERTRPVFRGLRQLRDELNKQGIFDYEIPHLSMGMSNDFEIAIEEGATWIRLGSVLVGKE
jgi:hypothetical protein